MTTKREDAASIVGAELAEEMDGLEQVTRSEAEVIRSDGAEVERMKNKKDMEDMEDDDHSEDEDHKKDKKHKKTKKQGEDMPMMESMGDSEPMYMPYGGATTFADLKAFLDSNKEQDRVSDIWYAFQVLSRNIWMCEMEDKPAAIAKLADEFKSMVKNKNAVIYESLAQMSLDSEPQPQVQAPDRVAELAAQVAQVDARVTEMLAKIEVLAAPAPAQAKSDHPLADSFTLLRSDFDSVLQMEGDATEKLQAIQPAFNALGEAIRQQLMTEPEIVTPVQKADDRLLALLEKMNDKLDLLNTVNRSTAQVPSTIPAPRSVPPSAIPQLGTAPVQRAAEGPAPKLRALIDKSVGL